MNSGNLLDKQELQALAKRLRAIREFKGLTRQQLAEQASLSVEWIKKLETTSGGMPKLDNLKAYCLALGLDIDLQLNYNLN